MSRPQLSKNETNKKASDVSLGGLIFNEIFHMHRRKSYKMDVDSIVHVLRHQCSNVLVEHCDKKLYLVIVHWQEKATHNMCEDVFLSLTHFIIAIMLHIDNLKIIEEIASSPFFQFLSIESLSGFLLDFETMTENRHF